MHCTVAIYTATCVNIVLGLKNKEVYYYSLIIYVLYKLMNNVFDGSVCTQKY